MGYLNNKKESIQQNKLKGPPEHKKESIQQNKLKGLPEQKKGIDTAE